MTLSELKTYIKNNISTNGIRAITGQILQNVLTTIADYIPTKVSQLDNDSKYVKPTDDVSGLKVGDETLGEIAKKEFGILRFDCIVPTATILQQSIVSTNVEVVYVIDQNVFVGRLGNVYYTNWGIPNINSSSNYNINGVARTDMLFCDTDNNFWKINNGAFVKISKSAKKYTTNAQVNRAIKELCIYSTPNGNVEPTNYYINVIVKNQGLGGFRSSTIEIFDVSLNDVAGNYTTINTPETIVKIEGTNFTAYAIIDWDAVGSGNNWYEDSGVDRAYITSLATKPEYSPAIYTYLNNN